MQYRVLVIDDEPSIGRSLNRVLTDEGYEVEVASNAADGMAQFEKSRPHLVLLDLKLPDASGFDLIERIHAIETSAQVIVLTAFGDTKAAVRAMKLGASDFLRKPYDLDELHLALKTAARSFSQQTELTVYRRRDHNRYTHTDFLWRSEAMEGVWDLIRKVAKSDATSVLISGESGTGKELVARAIHFEGERASGPFMDLNCSSFQETLIENELFGHERGAFTGASDLKRGLVELSDGGTLFLDEVGEMKVQTQAKLLRFLESRTFKRVGGNVDISINIRIIAATNDNLQKRIEEGLFRTDLFYRLKVVSIHLPPLRERHEDVNILADHFLKKFSSELHKRFTGMSDEVRHLFLRYRWPGNVRELKNLMERIVLIEDGQVLRLDHIPHEMIEACEIGQASLSNNGGAEDGEFRPLREIEDEYILQVLQHCDGNKSRSARVLGLSRQGLLDRLKRLSATQPSG